MNIYKIKKFLNMFNINEEIIKSCPNNVRPISSYPDYDENEVIALFSKESCINCKYSKKCSSKEYNETLNQVKIKHKLKIDSPINIINFEEMISASTINLDNELTYIDILNQGVDYRRQGKFEEAKERYLTAIRMEPKKSVAYFNLGKILYILGNYEASVKSYKVAYDLGELNNNIPQILEHMGHSLIDKENQDGKYKQAIRDYSRGMCTIKGFTIKTSQYLWVEYKRKCQDSALSYLKGFSE